MCVCVCEFPDITSEWHADDDKYDDIDVIIVVTCGQIMIVTKNQSRPLS